MSSGGGSGGGGGGIGASIGGIIGGYVGADAASGDKAKAQGYAEQAMNQLISLGMPPDLSKEIIYQKFQEAGILTPEMEQAIEIAHSKVAGMQEDPTGRNAQLEALGQLKDLSHAGLGAQDRADLSRVRNSVQRDLEAKRQQILQNQQARGMGGSGSELITQLQAAQGDANMASQQGMDIAGQAQQRALQALGQYGAMGSQVRGQDYTASMNKAQAEDELNRFNVQNQIARQQRNVANQNLASAQNLKNKQSLMNANVNQGNQELLRQGDAKHQYWEDQAKRNQILAGGYGGLSDEYGQRAATKAKQKQDEYTAWGGLISKAVKAIATYGGSEMMPSMGGGGNGGNTSSFAGGDSPYDDQEWSKKLKS